MSVDMNTLVSYYRNGLTFSIAKAVFEENIARYDQLGAKLQDTQRSGFVRFNAFLVDYKRYRQRELERPFGMENKP